jgi:hypothetical protein
MYYSVIAHVKHVNQIYINKYKTLNFKNIFKNLILGSSDSASSCQSCSG